MAEWFECVCQFLRAQSENLAGVMNGLQNQNTISDIGDTNSDILSQQLNNQQTLMSQVTPMQVFMVVLAVLWTYMFIFAQQNKETQKPVNNAANNDRRDDDHGANGGGVA